MFVHKSLIFCLQYWKTFLLGIEFWVNRFFPFSTFKVSHHYLLAFIILDKKCIIIVFLLLYIMFFPLWMYSIFSLSLVFNSSVLTCLSGICLFVCLIYLSFGCFEFFWLLFFIYTVEVLWALWIWDLLSYIIFGNFLAIIFVSYTLFILFYSGTPIACILDYSTLSHSTWMSLFFGHSIILFVYHFICYYPIFKFINLSSAETSLVIGWPKELFMFSVFFFLFVAILVVSHSFYLCLNFPSVHVCYKLFSLTHLTYLSWLF